MLAPTSKTKDYAEFVVRAYTADYIPKVTSHHFAMADVIQDLLYRDQGESTRFEIDEDAPPQQWKGQPEFNRIDPKVTAVFLGGRTYFGGDAIRAAYEAKADSSATFGLTLKARRQYQNCVMVQDVGTEPKPQSGYDTIRWKPLKGRIVGGKSRWETYRPVRFPGTTFITHTVQTPDEVAEAQTIETFAKNAQFAVTLLWRGVAQFQTKGAAFRLMWGGGKYSIVFRLGSAPTIEYYENGEWRNWKTLDDAARSTFQNETQTEVVVQRIAGRLVIGIDGQYFDLLRSDKAAGSPRGEGYELRAVTWQRGGLRVRAFGVSVMVGLSKLMHVDPLVVGETTPWKTAPKGFKPMKAEVERDVNRPGLTPRMDEEAAKGTGFADGWVENGCKANVETEVLTNAVRYICTLEAAPDGVSAPFVRTITARYLGLFTVGNAPSLDIAKACISGTETSAFPPYSPGAEWTLEVDRSVLDELSSDWQDYVKQFNPIEVLIRWKYTDGTYSNWVGRFKGYISVVSMKVEQANKWLMTLQLRDPIMRLQKPHATILWEYHPMDLLFFQKRGPLYGWECVKEILSIALGEAEGNRLIRLFPDFHYSLMSPNSDGGGFLANPFTAPPTGSKFKFPPPFRSSPYDWIQTFCKYDYAMFLYGYSDELSTGQTTSENIFGDIEWPFPIYGQYPLIIANRPTWSIPDDNYNPGDLNMLMFLSETTGLPEESINRAVTLANYPGISGGDLPFPAQIMAEATLPDDDPNAAIFSWARSVVAMGSQFSFPGAAQVHSSRVIAQYRNKKIRRYRFECRGEEKMQWGDKVVPEMTNKGAGGNYSDPHLNVHGEQFRIWRLQNNYRFHERNMNQFKTAGTCFPVSADGY